MWKEFHREIDSLPGENWQIYSLLGSLLAVVLIGLQITVFTDILYRLDYTVIGGGYTLADILISTLQVTLIGFLGAAMFSQGESYFSFISDEFDTKEMAILAKFGLMTGLGIVGGLILPRFLRNQMDFVTVQTLGLVIIAAYTVIHYEIVDWKLLNEKTILFTGLVLAFGPFIV